MNYKADSLEDIAKMFDSLAKAAKDAEGRAATKIAAVGCKREAHAYTDCANILRATTLGTPLDGVADDPRKPNLTCHKCRKQWPHNHTGPCAACGADAELIYL